MYFKTERLTVKPLLKSDRDVAIDILTDDVIKQTYILPEFQSREEAGKLFERLLKLSAAADRYVSGIYLGEKLIGLINETDVNKDSIEMGYALLPEYHNCGYATEAMTGGIHYLFGAGFSEVLAGAFEENDASIRVMVKSGMHRIARYDEINYRGKLHSCVYYSISKT